MPRPIRVLLVDDEPDFPEMAGTYLERADDRLAVTTASSAEEGLATLDAEPIDCVVSDYAMPEVDGIEFLEAVRAESPDLPFILYTGKGSEAVASEAISAGVTDYYRRGSAEDEFAVLANRVTNAIERVRSQRAAEETRSHLEAIAEHSPDAILTIDADSTIHFANAAVEDLLGYDPDALVGERLTELVPERFREEHLAGLDRYLETGERTMDWSNAELRAEHRDGAEIPVSVSFGEFEQDGERRFLGVVRDVSERLRIEDELRERERRFRQLAENVQEVVWMSDPEKDELLYVNPAYEELWGRSTESLYEDPPSFIEAVHPADRDRVEAAVADQRHGGYDEEYRILRPDGEVRWVHDRAIPITDDDGEVYRIVGIASDVTESKEHRRRLETLISNLPGIVYRCANEPEWPMEFVRGEAEAITGYAAEDIEGGEVTWGTDLIHQDDQEAVWESVQTAAEADEPFEVTYRIRTAGGETRWMWERGRVVTRSDGEEVLEGFITDITEREERERELERTERRYDAIFHDPNILVGLLAPDGTLLDVNETALGYVDGTAEDVVGQRLWETPWFEKGAPDDDTTAEWIDRAAGGEYVEFETELTRPDGTPYTVAGVFRPVRGDADAVHSIIVSVRDVTERKRRQARLRQYERAIESAEEMIAAVDEDYTYRFANRSYREYFDLEESAIGSATMPEIMEPSVFETAESYLEEAFAGETVRYRTTRTRPGEPKRSFAVQFAPLADDDGEVQAVAQTIRDLTEQREREQQLASLDRMLRHNLHNEMNVVLGYAERIAAEAPEEFAGYARTILESSERILEHADKEREIVALLTDQSPPQSFDLRTAVDRVVERMREAHPEAVITLEAPQRLRLTTIPELERAIAELVENAIDHSDQATPRVSIAVESREGAIVISVADDGPGIPPQEPAVIGEDSDIDPLVHSSGMGLWLVKRIVTRAGGTIHFEAGVDGEPDGDANGTTVSLVVPAR